jgi:hypothetical protein
MNNFCACPKISDETACGAAINCEWNASKECVNKAAGTIPTDPECKAITDKTKCEASAKVCKFTVTDPAKSTTVGTCAAKKCSELTVGTDCIRTSSRLTC